jgi:hypothetical protein
MTANTVQLTGFVGDAQALAVTMKVTADKAQAFAEELFADTSKVSNMLAYIRSQIVAGRDNLRTRDIEALALVSQCEDTLAAYALAQEAGQTDESNRQLDTLKAQIAFMAAKMPTTVYTETGKRETSELNSAAMRGLRVIAGRATRLSVADIPQALRAAMVEAVKQEKDRNEKKAAKIAAEVAAKNAPAIEAPAAE